MSCPALVNESKVVGGNVRHEEVVLLAVRRHACGKNGFVAVRETEFAHTAIVDAVNRLLVLNVQAVREIRVMECRIGSGAAHAGCLGRRIGIVHVVHQLDGDPIDALDGLRLRELLRTAVALIDALQVKLKTARLQI